MKRCEEAIGMDIADLDPDSEEHDWIGTWPIIEQDAAGVWRIVSVDPDKYPHHCLLCTVREGRPIRAGVKYGDNDALIDQETAEAMDIVPSMIDD